MIHLVFYTLILMVFGFAPSKNWAATVAAPTPKNTPATAAATAKYPKIVLYSASWCPHCREARNYMNSKGIPFIDRDVELDDNAMNDMKTKYKSRGVPVIVIGNDQKILKGFQPTTFDNAVKEVQQQQ